VAALRIDSELGLVDRREGEVAGFLALLADRPLRSARDRHAFSRAQEVARCGRDDALFAGKQRHLLLALDGDDTVVDLAREQSEGKADDSGRMAAHPLDREMGLARVGRAKDGPDRSV